MVFSTSKHHLFKSKRPSFQLQKTAFLNLIFNLSIFNELRIALRHHPTPQRIHTPLRRYFNPPRSEFTPHSTPPRRIKKRCSVHKRRCTAFFLMNLRLFFCTFLGGTEVVECILGEILHVSSLADYVLLGHAHIHIGRLLEEFRSAGGILK